MKLSLSSSVLATLVVTHPFHSVFACKKTGEWRVDTHDQGEVIHNDEFGNGCPGPYAFVFNTTNMGDDDYYIHFEQHGSKVKTFGEYKSSITNKAATNLGRSDSTGGVRVRYEWYVKSLGSTAYDLLLSKANETYIVLFHSDIDDIFGRGGCEGNFNWAVVSCGCPADEPFMVAPCTFGSPASASPAKCLGFGSKKPIVGSWAKASISASYVENATDPWYITHGTKISEGIELTDAISTSISSMVSLK